MNARNILWHQLRTDNAQRSRPGISACKAVMQIAERQVNEPLAGVLCEAESRVEPKTDCCRLPRRSLAVVIREIPKLPPQLRKRFVRLEAQLFYEDDSGSSSESKEGTFKTGDRQRVQKPDGHTANPMTHLVR